jgi:hypothetical protein
VKRPRRTKKSSEPIYTVSTDKHQGPKKGPSARREQRKASSGSEESQHSPMRKTYLSLFFLLLFFALDLWSTLRTTETGSRDGPRRDLASGAGQCAEQRLAHNRDLTRAAADRLEIQSIRAPAEIGTGTGSSEQRRLAGGARSGGGRPEEPDGRGAAGQEVADQNLGAGQEAAQFGWS